MDIAEHYEHYRAVMPSIPVECSGEDWDRMTQCKDEVRQRYTHPTDAELEWLLENLDDSEKSCFVSLALEGMESLDDRFLMPLVMGGVNEVDPSYNKRFVRPAVQHFGVRRVMECLFEVVKSGNPFQQSGAINALYWAQVSMRFKAGTKEFTIENLTPESREAYLSVADIGRDVSLHLLELFVTTDSVDVQRSIISQLALDKPTAYPKSHRHLVDQAIDIARSHTDDYIRHRVEVQLGNESRFAPLPHQNPNA